MIRRATIDDLPLIQALGAQFHAGSVYADLIEYDAEHFGLFAAQMMAQGGVIAISDKGFCGGVLAPVYFSSTAKIAAELFFYCNDNSGPALHAEFEAWAKEQGAEIVQMTGQVNARERGIRRLFESRGYTAREISFYKDL